MISIVERDEALRMLGVHEDAGCIFDADGSVMRCVHDQQRAMEASNPTFQIMLTNVIDEGLAYGKRAIGQAHLSLAIRLNPLKACRVELVQHMSDIAGGTNCRNDPDGRHVAGCSQRCRTAQAVTHEHRGRHSGCSHGLASRNQVTNVGGESRLSKFASALRDLRNRTLG